MAWHEHINLGVESVNKGAELKRKGEAASSDWAVKKSTPKNPDQETYERISAQTWDNHTDADHVLIYNQTIIAFGQYSVLAQTMLKATSTEGYWIFPRPNGK